MKSPAILLAAGAVWAVLAACSRSVEADAKLRTDDGQHFEQISNEDVHRLMRLSEGLYSGAEPKTDAAYAELARMGVRTVVNVDGAEPKLEMAEKYGLEYIHIPIGYDQIKEDQAAAIARVIRDREGPFYFHCHHGKHRGPAAAAIALMELTGCSADEGEQVLVEAGTSEGYPGLWRDVRGYVSPAANAVLPELVAVAEVGDFEAAMAHLDRSWDEMKLIQAAGFLSSAEHPDLDPHNVAKIVKQTLEQSAELSASTYAGEAPFMAEMEKSLEGARLLEAALNEDRLEDAQKAFDQIRVSCKACHIDYRND